MEHFDYFWCECFRCYGDERNIPIEYNEDFTALMNDKEFPRWNEEEDVAYNVALTSHVTEDDVVVKSLGKLSLVKKNIENDPRD